MTTIENWIKISELQNRYEVSNFGRIRSQRGIRKLSIHSSGYIIVCIKTNSKIKNLYMHRLVAIAFIPNPENKREVNHLDGDKTNNNDWNLEWATKSENTIHAFRNNLMRTHSKLREIQREQAIKRMKKVYHYSSNLELLNTFDSVKDAGFQLMFKNNLSLYCRTNQTTKLGIFSYRQMV